MTVTQLPDPFYLVAFMTLLVISTELVTLELIRHDKSRMRRRPRSSSKNGTCRTRTGARRHLNFSDKKFSQERHYLYEKDGGMD
jgi:hypothetical protein